MAFMALESEILLDWWRTTFVMATASHAVPRIIATEFN